MSTAAREHDRTERLLDELLARRGTDLFLSAGAPPMARVDGVVVPLEDGLLRAADIDAMADSLMPRGQHRVAGALREIDFSIDWGGSGRFRANIFRQRATTAIALRHIPAAIPTPAELGLPASVVALTELHQGLVLVTGPAGAGKSTTIASLLDHLNGTRACHIVTIEDPLEYLHRNRKALVEQREVGVDTETFASGLRSVLRQGPDVILVGELRDAETISAAVTIAETGHLVFASLHTKDAGQTTDRIVDAFAGDQQAQIRVQLAHSLAAIVYQQLLPRRKGEGMVAAFEVLIANSAVRNTIRESRTRTLRNIVATSGHEGMQTLERSLNELLTAGLIDYDTARAVSGHPADLRSPAGRRADQ